MPVLLTLLTLLSVPPPVLPSARQPVYVCLSARLAIFVWLYVRLSMCVCLFLSVQVRRGSEPTLNQVCAALPHFAPPPLRSDTSKRWSAAPIIDDDIQASSTPIKVSRGGDGTETAAETGTETETGRRRWRRRRRDGGGDGGGVTGAVPCLSSVAQG